MPTPLVSGAVLNMVDSCDSAIVETLRLEKCRMDKTMMGPKSEVRNHEKKYFNEDR